MHYMYTYSTYDSRQNIHEDITGSRQFPENPHTSSWAHVSQIVWCNTETLGDAPDRHRVATLLNQVLSVDLSLSIAVDPDVSRLGTFAFPLTILSFLIDPLEIKLLAFAHLLRLLSEHPASQLVHQPVIENMNFYNSMHVLSDGERNIYTLEILVLTSISTKTASNYMHMYIGATGMVVLVPL